MLIKDAATFLESIRMGAGGEPHEKDALTFLKEYHREVIAALNHLRLVGEKRDNALYWSGALMGEKIAARAIALHLKVVAAEQNKLGPEGPKA